MKDSKDPQKPRRCSFNNPCPGGYNCEGNTKCCKSKESVCDEPVDSGIECNTSSPSPRYYYDSERKSCQMFNYDGCEGNDNNFATMDECKKLCGSGSPSNGTRSNSPVVPSGQKDNGNFCFFFDWQVTF